MSLKETDRAKHVTKEGKTIASFRLWGGAVPLSVVQLDILHLRSVTDYIFFKVENNGI